MLINNEKKTTPRISDFIGVIPSITGKVELVYEGEQEGPAQVAQILIGKAVRALFAEHFPDPEKYKKDTDANPYREIVAWFGEGNHLDLLNDLPEAEYRKALDGIPGLAALVKRFHPKGDAEMRYLLMEFALHGLAEYSFLSKHLLDSGLQFRDLLSSMLPMGDPDEDEDDLSDSDFYR